MRKIICLVFLPFLCVGVDFNAFFKQEALDLSTVLNPFFYEEKGKDLKLQVIFNDRAKIDDGWYGKDDLVRGYKILEIGKDFVLLDGKEGSFILNIKRSSNKIQIQ